ncbi:MAG TPA: DUF3147 family protein [Candidatus Thermoplasmatota archaeon]|nr:DUF3147 family protein [Candidatus Thermoplasmatota archaeon]
MPALPVVVGLALLTGAAVALVTLLADRLGGKVGGLLATAPVTTSAALLFLSSTDPVSVHVRLMAAGGPLLASTVGIVGFFFAVKFTRGRPDPVRVAVGLLTYAAVFIGLALLFSQTLPAEPWVFGVLFIFHALLALTLMRVPIRVLEGYKPKARKLTWGEIGLRFAAGAAFFLALTGLATYAPALAPAFAVFPAVFMVSLGVMGLTQNAPFAARASQSGIFGTTAVALFVLSFDVLIIFGRAFSLLGAWVVYFFSLYGLGKVREHL